MKFILTFLLSILPILADGQQVHHCYVYQYWEHDSMNKVRVLTQTFNDKEKVVHEVAKGYVEYWDPPGMQSPVIQDGEYRYYYDDTLLVKKVEMLDASHSNVPDSTVIGFFYKRYNTVYKKTVEERKLYISKIDTYYSHQQRAMVAIYNGDVVRDRPDTTFFENDGKGNLVKITRRSDYESIEYDRNDRQVVDRSYSLSGIPQAFSTYTYGANSFRQIRHSGDDKYTITYLLDIGGRVVEEKASDYARKKAYSTDGRLLKAEYYHEDKLTTTHLFVYD